MKIKQLLIILTISTNAIYTFAQKSSNALSSSIHPKKFHIIASSGIGFPALLGYVLVKNANKTLIVNQSTNPFMAKLEYARKKWGVGATFTTNFLNVNLIWANTGSDPIIDHVLLNTWNIGIRGNYYFINKSHEHTINNLHWKDNFQLYLGGGVGYINLRQSTKTIKFSDPAVVIYPLHNFPMSFEATIGSRYFINQHIGLFFEVGLGNAPIQLIDKGASDSYLQGGITFRL